MKPKSRLVRLLGLLAGICGVAALLVAAPVPASAAVEKTNASGYCRTTVPPEETIALCGRNAHAKWAIGISPEGWESGYFSHPEDGGGLAWAGTFLTPDPGDIGISRYDGFYGQFVSGTVRPEVAFVVLVTEAGKRIPLAVGPDVRPDHFRYVGTWIELPDKAHELIGYDRTGKEVARGEISL
jgi:hypothetical protein